MSRLFSAFLEFCATRVWGSGHRSRQSLAAASGCLSLLLLSAFYLEGCATDPSGDDNNDSYGPQVEARIDQLANLRSVTIGGPSATVSSQEALYLGEQDGICSNVLVNFDLRDITTVEHPAELFTYANIRTVRLRLCKIQYYGRPDSSTTSDAQISYFEVRQLAAPFDTLAYAGYPGVVPSTHSVLINLDFLEPDTSQLPVLRLDKARFLAWLDAREVVGLMISLGAGSHPGLTGYASRDLHRFLEVPPLPVGTVVAPALVISFEDAQIPNVVLAPIADTSTFHVVRQAQSDASAFELRTCLRSYPALDFDLTPLRGDVWIDRAILHLTNDLNRSFGAPQAVLVSDFDARMLSGDAVCLSIDQLGLGAHTSSGNLTVVPATARHLALDVTSQIRGVANADTAQPRVLVLTGGESVLSPPETNMVGPEFYLSNLSFFGRAADDSLRPWLEITYRDHTAPTGIVTTPSASGIDDSARQTTPPGPIGRSNRVSAPKCRTLSRPGDADFLNSRGWMTSSWTIRRSVSFWSLSR